MGVQGRWEAGSGEWQQGLQRQKNEVMSVPQLRRLAIRRDRDVSLGGTPSFSKQLAWIPESCLPATL